MDDEQERRESTAQRVGQDLGVGVRNLASGLFSSTPVKEEEGGDDLSDLFEGPRETDNDMVIDHLVTVDEEDVFGEGGEDMSDILEVTAEDEAPSPEPKTASPKNVKLIRTDKPYPFGLTGMR